MAEQDDKLKRKDKGKRTKRYKEQERKAKSWAREWFDALLFAAIAALIIRTFFFEAYRIPTPSMEDTLMTGDFLVVSKMTYGPRTPMTLGIPFTGAYLPGVTLPWSRLPGLDNVDRYDIVVFNYPIDIAPISRKTNYIKRCVGLPKDTIAIEDKVLHVNHDKAEQFETVQQFHEVTVRKKVRLSKAKVRSAGGELVEASGPNSYVINMSDRVADKIAKWPEIKDIKLFVLPPDYNEYKKVDYTFASGFTNHDHIPPIVVPFEGQTVTLTPENWHIYKNVVSRYENNNVRRQGDQFFINGKQTNTYTIKKDYYFMMGDNRDNSQDSRYWGFVPRDHIVGSAAIIYFSWDSREYMPRFNRIFDIIN